MPNWNDILETYFSVMTPVSTQTLIAKVVPQLQGVDPAFIPSSIYEGLKWTVGEDGAKDFLKLQEALEQIGWSNAQTKELAPRPSDMEFSDSWCSEWMPYWMAHDRVKLETQYTEQCMSVLGCGRTHDLQKQLKILKNINTLFVKHGYTLEQLNAAVHKHAKKCSQDIWDVLGSIACDTKSINAQNFSGLKNAKAMAQAQEHLPQRVFGTLQALAYLLEFTPNPPTDPILPIPSKSRLSLKKCADWCGVSVGSTYATKMFELHNQYLQLSLVSALNSVVEPSAERRKPQRKM